MSKTVVFCANYGVINSTLYLTTHNRPITIIIPGNHDLFKFFQVINERVFHNTLELIYLELDYPGRVTAKGIKKVFHVFSNIIRERRYLKDFFDKYFAEWEGHDVFFASRFWCGYLLYLLKKLRKRNRLVFISTYPPYRTPARTHVPTNIVDLAKLIIAKLTYGRDLVMVKFPFENGIIYIPDKFIEKDVTRVIDWEERNEMLKGLDLNRFKVFDVGDYDVIYFSHGFLPDSVADPDMLKKELTAVFNILSKHFPANKIARKHHPGHNDDEPLVEIGDTLEAFIPAEFLYKDNVKAYLSLWSVSIAHVEKGLPISLMYLVSFQNNNTREQIREMLIQQQRSEILFPKSLDEFEKILIDLKEQTTKE